MYEIFECPRRVMKKMYRFLGLVFSGQLLTDISWERREGNVFKVTLVWSRSYVPCYRKATLWERLKLWWFYQRATKIK